MNGINWRHRYGNECSDAVVVAKWARYEPAKIRPVRDKAHQQKSIRRKYKRIKKA